MLRREPFGEFCMPRTRRRTPVRKGKEVLGRRFAMEAAVLTGITLALWSVTVAAYLYLASSGKHVHIPMLFPMIGGGMVIFSIGFILRWWWYRKM